MYNTYTVHDGIHTKPNIFAIIDTNHISQNRERSVICCLGEIQQSLEYQVKAFHICKDIQVGCCLFKEVKELISMCNFMAKYKQKNASIIINSPNDAIAIYIDTHLYSISQFEVLNSQHPSLSFLPIL